MVSRCFFFVKHRNKFSMNIQGGRGGFKGGEGSSRHKLFLEESSLLVKMKKKLKNFK